MDTRDHQAPGGKEEARAGDRGLGRFLADYVEEILAEWAKDARRLSTAAELPQPALYDSAPDFLESLARILTEGGVAEEAAVHHLIEDHALQRLEHGYSLAQAASEYALMRDVILRMWNDRADYPSSTDELRRFHRTIDRAIELAIAYFTGARDRAAGAIDRISVASFESQDLDELLHRLVHPVLEALPAVDTVAILLREGDVLRVRVAEGLGREAEVGFTVKVGEGFAGTIAATRKPVLLKSPAEGPLLRSPHLRERHVLALYGVPLIADGKVIGVAHMGSLTATEFRESDVRILDALAARATAAIFQMILRRERAELLEREQDARKRAEWAVRLREQVLAVVSHDLRNPLGATRMSAELILRRARELDERRIVRHAETIRRSVSRMDHMIADLLDVASIESGGLKVVPAPERAGSLLREAVRTQEPLAAEKEVHLRTEDETGAARIDVDPERMLQVFSNLVGNALKYSDPGDTITVRAWVAGDGVRFEVADNGPGIPEDELTEIFEPYWTRARKSQIGTGLGLFIAKGIVEAHHGRIWAESEAGRGTTFSFTLPSSGPGRSAPAPTR